MVNTALHVAPCAAAMLAAIAVVAAHRWLKQRNITRTSAQADVDARDARGSTALHRAAQGGDRQRVEQLLEAGANVEARTEQGQTPLHLAAAAVGPADLLPLLITPTTLEAEDNGGRTALQLAVNRISSRRTGLGAVNVLLEAGASPSAALFGTNPGQTAFSSVDWEQQVNLMLLGGMLAGPRPAGLVAEALRWRDGDGNTLLHLGAVSGCQQLVAQLVEAGADRNAVNEDGATPLWCAVDAGGAHVVHLVPLLATPDNINLPDGYRCRTPLEMAAEEDQTGELVAALLAEGASAQHDGYLSPLYIAAVWGSCPKVFALILDALAKECGQQEGQQQQQKGRQQQQEGQPELAALVAAAVAPRSRWLFDTFWCSRLLEVVLDVLGPGVAGEVCKQVQQLQQQEWEQEVQRRGRVYQAGSTLAEALLVGLVGAEERLHVARHPLLARLERLVPTVGDHHHPHQQQEEDKIADGAMLSLLLDGWPPGQAPQQVQLVQAATLAAAAGQQQQALRLLGKFGNAAHPVQQLEVWESGGCSCCLCTCCKSKSTFRKMLRQGLQQAACALSGLPVPEEPGVWKPLEGGDARVHHATSFHPPGVYTTFLAAWVEARRQLQQLPNEVTRAVVAAVKAAQQ